MPDVSLIFAALIVPITLTAILGHVLSEQDRTSSTVASTLEWVANPLIPTVTAFANARNAATSEEDRIGVEISCAHCFSGETIEVKSHPFPLALRSLPAQLRDGGARLPKNVTQPQDDDTVCRIDAVDADAVPIANLSAIHYS